MHRDILHVDVCSHLCSNPISTVTKSTAQRHMASSIAIQHRILMTWGAKHKQWIPKDTRNVDGQWYVDLHANDYGLAIVFGVPPDTLSFADGFLDRLRLLRNKAVDAEILKLLRTTFPLTSNVSAADRQRIEAEHLPQTTEITLAAMKAGSGGDAIECAETQIPVTVIVAVHFDPEVMQCL